MMTTFLFPLGSNTHVLEKEIHKGWGSTFLYNFLHKMFNKSARFHPQILVLPLMIPVFQEFCITDCVIFLDLLTSFIHSWTAAPSYITYKFSFCLLEIC